jgi:hypothetical protein
VSIIKDIIKHGGEDELIAEIGKLTLACESTLLFYSVSWTKEDEKHWNEICAALLPAKHHGDATTKTLCDIQRAALGREEGAA